MADRIREVGATVAEEDIPASPAALSGHIARIARLWAELHEADRALALELARKLPKMRIEREL